MAMLIKIMLAVAMVCVGIPWLVWLGVADHREQLYAYAKALLSERSTRVALLSLVALALHQGPVPSEWLAAVDALAAIYSALVAVRRDTDPLFPRRTA